MSSQPPGPDVGRDALAERYGTTSPRRRRLLVGAVVAVAVVAAGWLAWTTWVHSTPDVASELVSFEVVDSQSATAVVELDLSGDAADDPSAVTCTVRAVAADKAVVGQTTFSPTTADDLRLDVTVRTERTATSVESLGCVAPGQNRPR